MFVYFWYRIYILPKQYQFTFNLWVWMSLWWLPPLFHIRIYNVLVCHRYPKWSLTFRSMHFFIVFKYLEFQLQNVKKNYLLMSRSVIVLQHTLVNITSSQAVTLRNHSLSMGMADSNPVLPLLLLASQQYWYNSSERHLFVPSVQAAEQTS